MKSVTIKATKNTNEKTFTIGETYIYVDYNWNILKVIDITDYQIIFQDILTDNIYRSTIKQFDKTTSRVRNILHNADGRRRAFKDLFENDFEWFKSYYMN